MPSGPSRSIYQQYGVGSAVPRRRRPRWLYVLLGIPLVLLVGVGVYIGVLALATKNAYEQIFVPPARPTVAATAEPAVSSTTVPGEPTPAPAEATPAAILPEWQGTSRINILLLGVDRRGQEEVARTDTMIIVSIDPVEKKVGMLSIPRDLWVTIPGHGKDKINAAYPLAEMTKQPGGGPALLMKTIEQNFRIPVHYYASVDFQGFVKIVDTVGGITLEVPYALKDDAYPTDDGDNYMRFFIPSGLQKMDGVTALRYARSRNFDTDFGRQRRQQQVLQAIREQGLALNLVPRLPEFITILSGSIKTDFDPRQLPSFVRLGMEIDRANIKTYGITPDMTIVHDTPEIYYLEPNWTKINAALREMVGGEDAGSEETAPTAEPTAVRRAEATPAPAPTATRAPARPTATTAPERIRVWVRNGTNANGLAGRTAEVLRAKGYTIVDVTQDPKAGSYPQSIVYAYGVSRAQAGTVAQALGLPASAVKLGPAPAPAGTDVLVILGQDYAANH